MQPPQLAALDMGDSLPIYNGLREERRGIKEIEERKLLFAIIRTKFACYCKTLYKQIVIVKNTSKEESKRRRGEREGKEAHLDMRKESPFLTFQGVSALFYTPDPRGHQMSQLSPIWPIMCPK